MAQPVTLDARARDKDTLLTTKRESLWQDALRRLIRNRAAVIGGVIILILYLTAIFADKIAPYPYEKQTLVDQNKVPAWMLKVFPTMQPYAKISDKYLLGADYVGRDLFSRIVYGTRVSLTVALIGPLISLFIGVIYGSISGYFGGRLDNIMMRIVDVLYAFPGLLFIILLMAFFRSTFARPEPGTFTYTVSQLDARLGGMLFIFIGIGLTAWETMARLTRGQVLSMREKEFIEAARTIGATDLRIMFRHILPNIVGPLVVAETLAIPGYITTEAFLSFIGLGVNPPTPSWGSMISEGAQVIRTYPNQTIFPALALAITMFAFNFLGDGLRDALDPRLRGTQ
ncbi:ABC transporter permease [uncultured Thermanaerothrix sp.]|uniref:ABC transporter permease n=1 Tax=uncultured Thermanaerothrix sp. TaxID=1195149 RepID=UPI00260B97ED|nr:ABC transporter permease [uncultured Thermanaerothrix sp.]